MKPEIVEDLDNDDELLSQSTDFDGDSLERAADLIEKLDTSLREIARRGDLFPDLKQQIENMIVDIERA